MKERSTNVKFHNLSLISICQTYGIWGCGYLKVGVSHHLILDPVHTSISWDIGVWLLLDGCVLHSLSLKQYMYVIDRLGFGGVATFTCRWACPNIYIPLSWIQYICYRLVGILGACIQYMLYTSWDFGGMATFRWASPTYSTYAIHWLGFWGCGFRWACPTYLVLDPVHDLLTLPEVVNQLLSLQQLDALLPQLSQQQLPEAVELDEAGVDHVRGEVLGLDHDLPLVVQLVDDIAVGDDLGLEGLVLLELGLHGGEGMSGLGS